MGTCRVNNQTVAQREASRGHLPRSASSGSCAVHPSASCNGCWFQLSISAHNSLCYLAPRPGGLAAPPNACPLCCCMAPASGTRCLWSTGCARTYPGQLAFCPETFMNHGLAAASRHRPWWADEEPDKGCCACIEPLSQAEEARGLQAVHFRTGLVRHRHCRGIEPNVVTPLGGGKCSRV